MQKVVLVLAVMLSMAFAWKRPTGATLPTIPEEDEDTDVERSKQKFVLSIKN